MFTYRLTGAGVVLLPSTTPQSRRSTKPGGRRVPELAAFVVSDAADWMRGEVIVFDGGEWLRGAGEFNDLLDMPDSIWDSLRSNR